ncbi:hypothetical protein HK100_008674 [Physocladia obscura]|uniref:adenylate cyclase n=1 Tax=Physocladia obscura TaxID=109957 RepID=A0AAD5XJM1_9FUNG|nr:hypothetical protein HK100_008674 [Physocladia obscura]
MSTTRKTLPPLRIVPQKNQSPEVSDPTPQTATFIPVEPRTYAISSSEIKTVDPPSDKLLPSTSNSSSNTIDIPAIAVKPQIDTWTVKHVYPERKGKPLKTEGKVEYSPVIPLRDTTPSLLKADATSPFWSQLFVTPQNPKPPPVTPMPSSPPLKLVEKTAKNAIVGLNWIEFFFASIFAFICATYEVPLKIVDSPTTILSSETLNENSSSKQVDWNTLSENVPSKNSERMLMDTDFDSFGEYISPLLVFKSAELENEYRYSVLLPSLIIHYRIAAIVIGILALVQVISSSLSQNTGSGNWITAIYSAILVLSASIIFLATWKKGKIIAANYHKHLSMRIFMWITFLIGTCLYMTFDFSNGNTPGTVVGSIGNTMLFVIFLTSGVSGKFVKHLFSFLAVLSIVCAKMYLIYNQLNGGVYSWPSILIYFLPILASCLLGLDVMYLGDKDRRMKLLNSKIINARLKGLQDGSQKTEYLLSLTLPPMIVAKLKEVGTGNFDLIAERFDLSSTINSKMLIVGGLDKGDEVDHLLELIDMALVFRSLFKDEVTYNVDGGNEGSLKIKLQIAMGISIGPLVAGIVGKKTFCYEVYGDVVNTASRMLSIAKGGQIIVTSQVWERVESEYNGVFIGEREVKGKGLMRVYSIESSRLSEKIAQHKRSLSENSPAPNNNDSTNSLKNSGINSLEYVAEDDVPSDLIALGESFQRRATRENVNHQALRASFSTGKPERKINTSILNSVAAANNVTPAPLIFSEESLVPAQKQTMRRRYSAAIIATATAVREDSIGNANTSISSSIAALPTILKSTLRKSQGTRRQSEGFRARESGPLVINVFNSHSDELNFESQTNSISITIDDEVNRRPSVKSVAFKIESPDDDQEKLVAPLSLAPNLSASNLGLGSSKDHLQRRWSKLIFTKETDLDLPRRTSPGHSRRSSYVRPKQLDVKQDEGLSSELIIKQITSATNIAQPRMSIASAKTWHNDSTALSYEKLESKSNLSASDINAQNAIMKLSTDSLSDSIHQLSEVKKKVSQVSRTPRFKYILILTALATVGGYKEELSNEERAVLEHTGTLKFLMDDHCMDIVSNSMSPFLKFISSELENRYIFDTNDKMGQKFWNFSVKGMTCEAIVICVAMISIYSVENTTLEASNAAYPLIIITVLTIGSQFLITAVTTVPARTVLGPSTMLVLGIWSVITFVTIVIIASIPFIGLDKYPYLLSFVLPQFPIIHTFLLDGITFFNKFTINFTVAFGFLILNSNMDLCYGPLLMLFPYFSIFHMKETTVKSEYLMQLIATTQANLVKEESEKSKNVLTTILPKRIILRLLENPDTMFYEEFTMATVLHMDIAGFTAMSAKLEPLDIVKIFNNLFTFFDHLIQDFHLEKITTIGDAYVASSNLSSNSQDPRTSAISVCVVGLKMQSFVVNQVNETYLMKSKHKQVISMRIGINSGPCYGAIMGGDQNFRYDLMGDTVTNAEKIQEHCELAEVYISEATFNMVGNYHAFKTEIRDVQVGGQKVYILKSEQ